MTMKMPALISVIVPVYNVEPYLTACVESILAQTYSPIEIILVDDGSTDRSGEICDLYAQKDPRIQVIHKANEGLSSARNVGLKAASGEYIGFVDSDDTIEKDMYQTLWLLMKQAHADIVECKLRWVYPTTETHQEVKSRKAEINQKETIRRMSNIEATAAFLDRSVDISGCVCGKLYRKEIIECIPFPRGRLHEDAFFTYKALYFSPVYARIEKYGYNYRQDRPGSIMTKKISPQNIRDVLDAFEERNHFFAEEKQDKLLKKAKAYYYQTLLSYYREVSENLPYEKELLYFIKSRLAQAKQEKAYAFCSPKWRMQYALFCCSPRLFLYTSALWEKMCS